MSPVRKVLVILWSLVGVLLPRPPGGCARPLEDDRASEHINCYVSILPEKFFVERIGGDYVEVQVMVGPGQVPHTYEPKSRQLTELAGARVYFSIGVEFEASLLPRIERNFRSLRIVDASAGIRKRSMTHDHRTDSETSGHTRNASPNASQSMERRQGGLDPHVWLSPRLAVLICANIRDALTEIQEFHAEYFSSRFEDLKTELESADRRIAQDLSPYRGREILVYHPAFGYFADDYGLVQVEIEQNGSMPGPKHLAEVIDLARARGATVIFVQPQVSDTYARTVADAIGGRVVPLDPLAEPYIQNLEIMASRIAESFEKP
jgi:zinc transport system substrate-binding protein